MSGMRNHGAVGKKRTYLTNPIGHDEGGQPISSRKTGGQDDVARGVEDVPPVKAGSICTSFPSLSCARRSKTDRIDATVMKIAAVE